MKKKMIMAVLCGVLLISGCAKKTVEPIPEPLEEAALVIVDEPVEPIEPIAIEEAIELEEVIERSEVMVDFQSLIKPSYTSVDIALFIEDRINEARPSEAEYMMTYLMVYQTEFIKQGEDVLFLAEYMDALNNDMDGILDKTKISNIDNEKIRVFYQNLSDSFLTIVRYEETPVVEIDWDKIADLEATFSSGFQYVVDARSYKGEIDYLDYYNIAERAIALEAMIRTETSLFVKEQMLELHDSWTNYLVVGPEGSHIDSYLNKEGELYQEMVEFSTDYSESIFGTFMNTLVTGDYEDYMGAYDLYDIFTRTNKLSNHTWIYETISEGENSIQLLMYSNLVDPEVTIAINTLIQSCVDEVIAGIGSPVPYKLKIYEYHSSEESVTLLISASYSKSETERGFVEKFLNIDMKSGRNLLLNDYLQVSQEEALKIINDLEDADFTLLPAYERSWYGIILRANNADPSETRFALIPYKYLVPYIQAVAYPVVVDEKTPTELFDDKLNEIILSNYSTAEYVEYMTNQMSEATPEEAEKMIETLMIFQTKTILDNNGKFSDEAYLEASYEFIDKALDREKIEAIEDEEIRAFFSEIKKSYLKVVDGEEIPYLTMDWSRIVELDTTFSEAFTYVIETRNNQEKQHKETYYETAKRTIKLEVLEDRVSSPFVLAQLEMLYDEWASNLLMGIEGYHYDAYMTKRGDLYEEMLGFSEQYPGSELGQFVKTIVEASDLSYAQITGMIDAFILSENIGNKKWTMKEVGNEGSSIHQLVYQEIGNSEISDKINLNISERIALLTQQAFDDGAMNEEPYTIESTYFYKENNLVTLHMNIRYKTSEIEKSQKTTTMMIDLKNGTVIKLDNYLGVNEDEAIKIVNGLGGSDFTMLADFQLTSIGIFLTAVSDDPSESRYESISRRALMPYVNKNRE